jgi:hypothetical protein
MHMKIIIVGALCFLGSVSAFAQTSDAEAEAMANLLGVQKKEIIGKLVPVSGKDSVNFWKVYAEYQQANRTNSKGRIKLYEGTALMYPHMTPAIADSLAGQYFRNRNDQEKLLEVYYKKIKEATNATIAFEFYQAEIYLLTQLRAQIMRQIPTYGQLQNLQK